MAAPSKYLSPDEQLLSLARDARDAGEPFEEFWRRVVRMGRPNILTSTPPERRPAAPCVLWPSDSGDRITWQGAIYESVEGWRRAYELAPALPSEQALELLRPLLDRLRQLVAADEDVTEGFDPALALA